MPQRMILNILKNSLSNYFFFHAKSNKKPDLLNLLVFILNYLTIFARKIISRSEYHTKNWVFMESVIFMEP
jgi:hypothetical protein